MRLEPRDEAPRGYPDLRANIKLPAFGGTVVIFKRKGRIQAALFKKPPSRQTLEAAKPWHLWLKAANLAWKYLPWEVKRNFIEAAEGIPFRPIELFEAVVIGSMFSITTEDGQTIYPFRAKYYVGQALDLLAKIPGSLLRRGADNWEGLHPPTAGNFVLASTDQDRLPHWEPMPTGSGGGSDPIWAVPLSPPTPAQGWQDLRLLTKVRTWTTRGVTIVQDSATTEGPGGIQLTPPSPPWTVTAAFTMDIFTNQNYQGYRLAAMNASTGRIEGVTLEFAGPNVILQRLNNLDSWNANLVTLGGLWPLATRMVAKIQHTGTALRYYVSASGAHYRLLGERPLSEFLGQANRIIFVVHGIAGTPTGATMVHFALTTP